MSSIMRRRRGVMCGSFASERDGSEEPVHDAAAERRRGVEAGGRNAPGRRGRRARWWEPSDQEERPRSSGSSGSSFLPTAKRFSQHQVTEFKAMQEPAISDKRRAAPLRSGCWRDDVNTGGSPSPSVSYCPRVSAGMSSTSRTGRLRLSLGSSCRMSTIVILQRETCGDRLGPHRAHTNRRCMPTIRRSSSRRAIIGQWSPRPRCDLRRKANADRRCVGSLQPCRGEGYLGDSTQRL